MVLEKFFCKMANHKQELSMTAIEILHRLSGIRGEEFSEIDQSEARIAYIVHVVC